MCPVHPPVSLRGSIKLMAPTTCRLRCATCRRPYQRRPAARRRAKCPAGRCTSSSSCSSSLDTSPQSAAASSSLAMCPARKFFPHFPHRLHHLTVVPSSSSLLRGSAPLGRRRSVRGSTPTNDESSSCSLSHVSSAPPPGAQQSAIMCPNLPQLWQVLRD